MRQRSLISLACATVVLVVLAMVALVTGDHGVSRAAPNLRAFPALAAQVGDVASVTVSRDGSTMTFIRDGDSWLVSERGNYPANPVKISQIASKSSPHVLLSSAPRLYHAIVFSHAKVTDLSTASRYSL